MKKVFYLTIVVLLSTLVTHGQALVYRAQNPSFGGDTFNYNWMLSSAQAQNKLKDPLAAVNKDATKMDALADFTNGLNRQILNSISQRLFKDQFGEEGIKEGTYTFGDFVVDVSPGSGGLIIRITDGKGGETSITVPYY